jgi:hypothetical protein
LKLPEFFLGRAMTGPKTGPLPLAFALAMAADVSAAGVASVPEGEYLWRVGSLSRLLGDSETSRLNGMVQGPSAATPEELAQWLNFRNCFSGNWRNC